MATRLKVIGLFELTYQNKYLCCTWRTRVEPAHMTEQLEFHLVQFFHVSTVKKFNLNLNIVARSSSILYIRFLQWHYYYLLSQLSFLECFQVMIAAFRIVCCRMIIIIAIFIWSVNLRFFVFSPVEQWRIQDISYRRHMLAPFIFVSCCWRWRWASNIWTRCTGHFFVVQVT